MSFQTPFIEKIKVGFEAPEEYYEQGEEFEKSFKEFQKLKEDNKS